MMDDYMMMLITTLAMMFTPWLIYLFWCRYFSDY